MTESYSIIELLEKIASHLDSVKIEYMISGSLALNIYSESRSTNDIDIVVNLKLEQLDVLLVFFSENYYFSEEAIKVEVGKKGMFNVISETTGFKVDFIVKKDSDYRNMEFSRRSRKRILNKFEAWVVSAEDLILSKLIWIQELESDRQKNDIKSILDLQRNLDKTYLENWCKKLSLKTYGLL